MRRPAILLALTAAGILLAGCWLTPPAREAVRTVRLLPAFFVGLPVRPEAWGREPPAVSVEPLAASEGPAFLHTYRPAGGRHPAVILSLGVNPAPADDPRVVRLLSGLAYAGLVAVLVESQALNEDRITREAPELLVRAFERVAADPNVRRDRVGFAGFSVGAGLVSIAAADARIRDRVALVEAFGGYFNIEDLVAAATTGTIRDGVVPSGERGGDPSAVSAFKEWSPDPLTRSVVAKNLIAPVPDAVQREALVTALQADDGLARAALVDHARAVHDVLTNSDPARAGDLYARLPAGQREELRSLSPAAHVEGLRTRVFLMHDRGDHLIPYVESRRYRAALADMGRPPYASEFDIFEHVDPTRGGSPRIVARDLVNLFMHMYAVLARLG